MGNTLEQDIRVRIDTFINGLPAVEKFSAAIGKLKTGDGKKLSIADPASATNTDKLAQSVDKLAAAVEKLDDSKVGKLAKAFQFLSNVSNVLGHIKGTIEGVQFLLGLGEKFPAFGAKLSNAGNAIGGFFALARDKIGSAASAVKTKVASLAEDLPGMATGLASGTAGLVGIGVAGTVATGGLLAVVAAVAAIVAALATIPIVAGFLLNLANTTAETGAKFHDLNQQTGVSVELLSSLAPVADDSNGSIEDLARGIGKFNKLIGEAAGGNKEAIATLKEFDLTATEALGNTDAALEKVIKRILELPPGTQQAIAAQKAFGKSGAELIPTLIATGGNLEAVKKKAIELGVYWTGDGANAADEYGDKVNEIKRIIEGLGQSIGRVLIPELLKLLRIFAHEGSGAVEAFTFALRFLNNFIKGVTASVMFLIAALNTLRGKRGIGAGAQAGGGTIGSNDASFVSPIGDGSFAANWRELRQIANTASQDTTHGTDPLDFNSPGGGGKGGGKRRNPDDAFAAIFGFNKAAAESALTLLKDSLERQLKAVQESFEKRKISIRDFYAEEERLQRQSLNFEIEFTKQAVVNEQQRLAHSVRTIQKDTSLDDAEKAAKIENETKDSAAAIVGLNEQLVILLRKRADLAGEIATKETDASRKLQDQLQPVIDQIDRAKGLGPLVDARNQIAQLNEQIAELRLNGEDFAAELLEQWTEVLATAGQVFAIEQRLGPLGQQFDIDRLNVETQVSRHVITQREGRKQIIALQRKYLEAQLEILKLELATTNEERLQLEIKLKIADAENALANLKEVDQAARSINDSLRGGLEDFFGSLADGTKNLKEAFADLGTFIIQMFARLAAAKLVQSIFGKLLGDEDGEGGIGGFLSGLFGGKKAAGDMIGARPGGQLIQVGEGGHDELVVTTDPSFAGRTSRLLAQFIRRTGILPRFAAGGFTSSAILSSIASRMPSFDPGLGSFALAGAGAASVGDSRTVHLKQVLVYDPRHVHDAMRSDGGEEVFMNFIDRNASAIRRRLKI